MGRERLFEVLAILMESLWYFGFASAFLAWFADDAGPPFWAIFLAAFGSFYTARVLGRLDISLQTMRVLAVIVSTVCLYVLLRMAYLDDLRLWNMAWLGHFVEHPGTAQAPIVFGCLLTSLLWLRWAVQAQNSLTFDTIVTSFSVGFVATVLGSLIDISDGISTATDEVLIPFFAIGLLTLAVFRIGRTTPDATPTPFDRPWVIASLGLVGVMVLVAAPAWLIGTVDASPVLEPVGRGLGWIVDGIIAVLAVPVGLFFDFMGWLVLRLIGSPIVEEQELSEALREPEEVQGENKFRTPFLIIGRTIAGLILAGFFMALAWLIFSRLGRGRRDRAELRESVWHEGSLFEDVGDLLGKLFARKVRRAVPTPNLSPDLLAVRRLYLDVLERAEDRGLERPPAKTPLEFAPPLSEHFHSTIPDRVSRAFTRARYGLKTTPASDIERLRKEWRETER